MASDKSIAELAYQLWDARGRPGGSEEEDWLEAQRQLTQADGATQGSTSAQGAVDHSLEETFPASDPPASHIPDVPPANSADKWRAAATAKEPPVDETDDAPATAPGDIGEGP